MKITMLLSVPARYWWTYLAIKSNPAIAHKLRDNCDRAIFFDDLRAEEIARRMMHADRSRARYFYVFWDAVGDFGKIEPVIEALGKGARITFLVVGDYSGMLDKGLDIGSLYADGAVTFDARPVKLDFRTSIRMLAARGKHVLAPVKNILHSKGSLLRACALLFGRRQILFCGSSGIRPLYLKQMCERHAVDFSAFEGFPYEAGAGEQQGLNEKAHFILKLYRNGRINPIFFQSLMHLLGREYFLNRIRMATDSYLFNDYGSGAFIDVYSTPFYAQHRYIDFGSMAGTGNYPRLMELHYFGKDFVRIPLNHIEIDLLAQIVETGRISSHFEGLWQEARDRLLAEGDGK